MRGLLDNIQKRGSLANAYEIVSSQYVIMNYILGRQGASWESHAQKLEL